MFELVVHTSADVLLRELEGRGLVVKLETFDKTLNGPHWHVGFPKRPGVLEITDLGETVHLKVGTKRDGGWATALAHELADQLRRR